jgi:N-acetylmuramic acid 6-phosphate etherase
MSTETVDPRFIDIDHWPTETAVEAMLESQLIALASVKSQLAGIAAAADAAARQLRHSGRLIYVGAGTSGRIAVQDGVELFPTYGWPQDRLVFLMAGGSAALTQSAEGAEDDASAGETAILENRVGRDDVVIGVAASGRTPYTLAALRTARERGALTIGLANNPGTPLLAAADHPLLADTGSEVVAGSTRMKAGTAQKAVLNMLSTAMMLRSGLVYRGLMVNMRVSNEKLQRRGASIIRDLTGVDLERAAAALDAADHSINTGILIALGAERDIAATLLERNDQNLRRAIDEWRARGPENG